MTKSRRQEKINGTPDGAAIIAGIQTDALSEEQQIIKEAQTQAAEKIAYTGKRIQSMFDDARRDGLEQANKVKKRLIAGVQLELKRRSLNVRGQVMRDIINMVENKFASMTNNADYRTLLANWITEAAIGLDAQSAQINASEKDKTFINDQLISEVTEKVRQKKGSQVSLKLSQESALKSQGVVLTSDDGRMAFNNQVKTRMLRKEREIRMAIYDALFTDKRKEDK